jgi:hypothetical protein
MPKVGDPRVTIRFSVSDHAVLDAAAVSCGVETGALIREAALRSAAAVARDVTEGRVSLRRRAGLEKESASTVSVPEAAGGDRGAASAPSRALALDPGVERAAMFRRALEGRSGREGVGSSARGGAVRGAGPAGDVDARRVGELVRLVGSFGRRVARPSWIPEVAPGRFCVEISDGVVAIVQPAPVVGEVAAGRDGVDARDGVVAGARERRMSVIRRGVRGRVRGVGRTCRRVRVGAETLRTRTSSEGSTREAIMATVKGQVTLHGRFSAGARVRW